MKNFKVLRPVIVKAQKYMAPMKWNGSTGRNWQQTPLHTKKVESYKNF